MSTFSRMGVWPVGYFRAYSGWLLGNRRGIGARIATIKAEIERIGFVEVVYQPYEEGGDTKRTEVRIGINVTEDSTLERLMQAYVAQGGNPLEISSFMHPQSTQVQSDGEGEGVSSHRYPFGGLVAPRSAEYNEPLPNEETLESGYGVYPGGMPRTHKYFPARQGGQISTGAYDYTAVVRSMHQMRAWANQDIKERLSDLEARIIKQCDLREQLQHEIQVVLVQAFGGVLQGVDNLDIEQFDRNLMVQNMIRDMEDLVYERDSSGSAVAPRHRPDAYLEFTFPAVPSDFMVELGM